MPTEPMTVTRSTIAPSPANWLLRTIVIITTELITPAMGMRVCRAPPVLPSGRLGGGSMVRASGVGSGRVVRAGRWTMRVLIGCFACSWLG